MNIAMFTDSYKPQINGVVTSIDIFTKYLRKKGHKVYIFAPADKNAKKEEFVFRFESFSFEAYHGYRIGVPYKILLDPQIKKIKFDIVHVHSPFSMGTAGIGFAKYYKIPIIGTFHTLFPDYVHYFIRSKMLQNIKFLKKIFQKSSWSYLTWFYNRCSIIIAPSEEIRNALVKKGIKRRVVTIPTGIEAEIKKKSKKALRKKYGFGDEKIILHVGRVTKEKNIKFIIDALKNLLNEKNIKLVITSDGPYKDELERYVRKINHEKNIIFTGYLSSEQLSDFYNLSDIFVLASETETQGIVLAEAAINKLPIVVLDAPVTSDFVRENKIGIVSGIRNFSRNIGLLLQSKNLREKYTKNSRNLVKKYDIEKCTNNLLNVYKEAIAKRKY